MTATAAATSATDTRLSRKNGRTFELVLLIRDDPAKPYGAKTVHGFLWAATIDDLHRRLKFAFGVRLVVQVDGWLWEEGPLKTTAARRPR